MQNPTNFTAQNYYPFGMVMPGRSYTSSGGDYRFGFQGQEKNSDLSGVDGGHLDFKYRIHDARLGRFLSVDPLAASFSWNSPYAFSENRVTNSIELEGLEAIDLNSTDPVEGIHFIENATIPNSQPMEDGNGSFKNSTRAGNYTMIPSYNPDGDLTHYTARNTNFENGMYRDEWIVGANDLSSFRRQEGGTWRKPSVLANNVYAAMEMGASRNFDASTIAENYLNTISNPINWIIGAHIGVGAIESFSMAGFSSAEKAIIKEAQGIMGSQELTVLRTASAEGVYAEVTIGNRTIAFDPQIPTGKGYFAVTNGMNGFNLGADAFLSETELATTVTWELHRLHLSPVVATGGASGSSASISTQSAARFARSASQFVK